MSAKVSIIIPTYNVEKYITQTLNSVINQTLTDIEIIIIDDKSTDDTLLIIENYALADKRIRLFLNSNNYKQGYSRNLGIEKATGDYIFFLDGDDYIQINAIEKLYNKITQDNADITICTWNKINDKNNKISFNNYSKLQNIPTELNDKTFNWIDIKDNFFKQTTVPWDKIYKREFLIKNNIKFPEDIFFEDNTFVFEALLKAEKISILREDLIFYRYNRKNAVTNTNNQHFIDYFKAINLFEYKLITLNLFEKLKYEFLNHKIITLYWYFMKIQRRFKKEFFELIKEDFNRLNLSDEEKSLLSNRALFLLNRFTSLSFEQYYPKYYYLDKIFRVEKGKKNLIIFFSKYPQKYKNF